jgi:hypothetical protein
MDIVRSIRARLTAIAIVAAVLTTGAGSLFANGMVHHACLAHHHDCSTTARLTGCCGLEQGDRSNEAIPTTGKTQVAQPVADGTIVVRCAQLTEPDLLRHARAFSTAPRSSLPDLITLFGTFLI